QGDFRAVDGSDGDWSAAMLWGKDFDQSNLMFSAEYSHRSELPVGERDWAIQEFADNSTPWAPYHNYGTYILRPADANFPFAPDIPGLGRTLGVVQDFTTAECEGATGPVQGVVQSISGL